MDTRYGAAAIVERVQRRLFPGAIVLLHDGVGPNSKYGKNRKATAKALPSLLQTCAEWGLAPVTLSQMFGGEKGPTK